MSSLPRPLAWLWEGWKRLSRAIGVVMSTFVLTVLWVVVFGLYALLLKTGRLLKREPVASSYWRDIEPDYPDSLLHGF